MSDESPEALRRRIAELKQSLPGLPDAVRPLVEREIAALDATLAALGQPASPLIDLGTNNQMGNLTVQGDVAGGALVKTTESAQTISVTGGYVAQIIAKAIFGRDPAEDEARRLGWYLAALAGKLRGLLLRGLDEQLAQGDGIALPHVYITMATTGQVRLAAEGEPAFAACFVDGKVDGPLTPAHDPDDALPDRAVVRDVAGLPVDRAPDGRATPRTLYRAQLATEVIAHQRRLVLLGAPGAGKSTVLRYLAWALAQRAVGDGAAAPSLLGWPPDRPALPILLPLRDLAGRIEREGARDAVITEALRQQFADHGVPQADDLLAESLRSGVALLLLDGLDEVPLQRVAGQSAARRSVLDALRSFLATYPQARAALTCRTRAFDETLRAALGWPVAELAPLTLGQARFFVAAWYGELAAKGQITQARAAQLGAGLLAAIAARPQLRRMAETPLLLTMMAIVLYNKNELPRDRPQLYERILELLLGQWDQVRDGVGLAQAIGAAGWGSAEIRPLIDQLSYEAHGGVRSDDGRGRLEQTAVMKALITFFEAAQLPDAWGAAGRCLDYINHRSGLLVPDDAQDSYVFAHLTFQEHCAGRALVIHRDALARVLQHRHDDRWREPILLGLGVVQPTNPYLIEAVLRRLISRSEDDRPKPPATWQRDLILAAEIGKDRDWPALAKLGVDVTGIQADLRAGLAALLGDRSQPLPVAERVRAGFLLGELGDPRFPVTAEQWGEQLRKALAGDPAGYFCRVEPGLYLIGSTDADQQARDEEKPQHTFQLEQPIWAGRFPITNAQWQVWVEQGGERSFYADNEAFNTANQPVVTVSWNMVNAFCAWLTERLQGVLPAGLVVRLPTEQEWEALARGGDGRIYPWDDGPLTPELAIYAENSSERSAPVGCCPAGASLCGALDVVGNVWEWTASVWRSYPGAEKAFTEERYRILRGGSWYNDSSYVRCGARVRYRVGIDFLNDGFRCVVAPPLAQMS